MSWAVDYEDATGHTTIYTGKVNIKGRNSSDNSTLRTSDQLGTIGAGQYTVNYRRLGD